MSTLPTYGLPDRFWSKVRRGGTDSCWEWTAYKTHDGYGQFHDRSGRFPGRRVHRIAYSAACGSIPDGMVLDHVCRNRACVNPAHLRVTTNAGNVMAGTSFGPTNAAKTHCQKGHPYEGENLRFVGRHRRCRACDRASQARFRERHALDEAVRRG